MEIRIRWYEALWPVGLFAFAVFLALKLHVAWTFPKLGFFAAFGVSCLVPAYVALRKRLVVGPFGIQTFTWQGKSALVWEDVGRFYCDGKRLVVLDGSGDLLFELSREEGYGNVSSFMEHVIAELRKRAVLERRRDALVMTATEQYRLDRLHRFWPVGLLALIAGLVVISHRIDAATILSLLALAGLAALFVWLQHRDRVTIGPQGIEQRGWILTDTVRWDDIASYRYEEERSGDWVSEWGDLLLWIVGSVLLGPPRWLARHAIYGKRSRRFYAGYLTLLDARGRKLWRLEASTGWENVEDAFDRILDELAEREVNFSRKAA